MEKIEVNKIYNEDAIQTMKRMPNDFLDCVVTSPPYDNLRDYNGYSFPFEEIATELYRTMKPGGVVVWVVGDAVIDGGETLSSFRQALFFQSLGFKMHDVMIYEKNGTSFPARRDGNRYSQIFEYSFVFVKGESKCKIQRLNQRMKPEDCAWLASALDGEGCFRIRYNGNGGSIHSNLNVSNSDIRYVQKCKDITGLGNVSSNPDNTFHEWNVGSDDAAKIAAEIYPYLVIKKERAKVIIEAQRMIRKDSKPGRSSSLTEDEKKNRSNLFEILKKLNNGEITDSGLPEPELEIVIKGKPKTANLICDKENRWAGFTSFGKSKIRTKDGQLVEREMKPVPTHSPRNNIWRYNTGKNYSTKDEIAFGHPAIFPEALVEDHLKSWTLEGDIIYDPFMGSGTTGKVCVLNNRNYIGSEISKEYCDIAEKRIDLYKNKENV